MPGSAREPIDYHGEAWLSMSSYEYDHSWEREGCPGCKHNADVAAEAVAAERARLRALVEGIQVAASLMERHAANDPLVLVRVSRETFRDLIVQPLAAVLAALEGPDAR